MSVQLTLDRASVADEQESNLEMTGSDQRAIDDACGRLVATHRVDGDTHSVVSRFVVSRESLFLWDGAHLAALVVAAVRADLVRRLRFLTLRAGAG